MSEGLPQSRDSGGDPDSLGRFAFLTLGGLVADRGFGIVFTVLMSASFGTSAELDAYLLAVTPPTLLATLLGDVLYSQLLPEFAKTGRGRGDSRWNVFVSSLAALLAIAVLYAGVWTAGAATFASDYQGQRLLTLGVLLSPMIFFGGASSLCATILIGERRYALPASRFPLSSAVTVAVFVLARRLDIGIYAAVVSVLAGTIVTAIVMAAAAVPGLGARASELTPTSSFAFLRRVTSSSLAQLMAAAATQATALVERFIGISIGTGVVASLNYGRVLSSPPLLVAQSLATASYPRFVGNASQSKRTRFRGVGDSVGLVTFLMLPLSTLLGAVAQPLVRVVYVRGSFSDESAAATSVATAIFAVGILPLAVTAVLVRFLYAERQAPRVARISTFGLAAYCALALGLAHAFGYAGLASASTIANALVMLALLVSIHRWARSWDHVPLRSIVRTTLASTVMLFTVILTSIALAPTQSDGTVIMAQLAVGVAVFVVAAVALRCPELARAAFTVRDFRS